MFTGLTWLPLDLYFFIWIKNFLKITGLFINDLKYRLISILLFHFVYVFYIISGWGEGSYRSRMSGITK